MEHNTGYKHATEVLHDISLESNTGDKQGSGGACLASAENATQDTSMHLRCCSLECNTGDKQGSGGACLASVENATQGSNRGVKGLA